ncbi:MAG: 3D domain-containing protein [Christensenellaceae bacterium]|jgi:3D (Asp-Asp-Asp) domain-containing protein
MIKKIIVFLLVILFLILMTLYTPRYHLKGIFAQELDEWTPPAHIGQSWNPAEYENGLYQLESSFKATKVKEVATPKAKAETPTSETGEYYEITLRVTAYCTACNSGGTVARPNIHPLGYGAVAVKTSQFAYGTVFEIPNYGRGVACDTGGFSVGTIDVCLGYREVCTCGSEWGEQFLTVKVYK